MGWSKFRKKFKRRIKKLGKTAIPLAAVFGAMIPVVGGVVSTLANGYAEKRAGLPSEEEALADLPALPTSAATVETKVEGDSFPFNLPGVGGLLKSIFG